MAGEVEVSKQDSRTLDSIWETLEKTTRSGVHFRRLDTDIPLKATIANPDRHLGLQIEVANELSFEPSELVGSAHISIDATSHRSGTVVRLLLTDQSGRDMFVRLCDDIIPRVLAQKTEIAAATMLVRRFASWQRFLRRSAAHGLSRQQQLGLYGELKALQEILLPHLDSYQAVLSWTGPTGAPQDFQLDGIAIEVKTIVHGEPQKLPIDGERQLDDFGLSALVLTHYRVLKHNQSGEFLPDLVNAIRDQIAEDEGPSDDFEDKLLSYGYADDDAGLYGQVGYSVREVSHYRILPGFPRITESDLRPGMGALQYSIDASACVRFEIEPSNIVSWLTDPPTVSDPRESTESGQIEYKQTAWTPMEEGKTKEHHEQLVRELQRSVIKSVVAFLNTDGGELVIGVHDQTREVTGIELDLESRGRARDDLDWYEQAIVALLSDTIDDAVHSHVRIKFTSHEAGNACHLIVRPSPTPRFGHPPPRPNQKKLPVFWIRAGNTTRELSGAELATYLFSHWA